MAEAECGRRLRIDGLSPRRRGSSRARGDRGRPGRLAGESIRSFRSSSQVGHSSADARIQDSGPSDQQASIQEDMRLPCLGRCRAIALRRVLRPWLRLVRHAGPQIAVRNRHGTVSRFDHRSPHTHRSRNRPRQGRCPPGRAKGEPVSDLLDLALKAHGGIDRWREVKSLDVRVSLTGALYDLKGYPEGVSNVTVKIDTRRPAVMISPYARPDHRGYFTPDRVWIEDRAGQIVDERRDPRASFAGHVRETPWDQLHRLYFTGYAMWNYLTTPFLFAPPGFECTENEPHQENGETWCLRVRFPPNVPTHNNFQVAASRHFSSTERGSPMLLSRDSLR